MEEQLVDPPLNIRDLFLHNNNIFLSEVVHLSLYEKNRLHSFLMVGFFEYPAVFESGVLPVYLSRDDSADTIWKKEATLPHTDQLLNILDLAFLLLLSSARWFIYHNLGKKS